MPGSVLGLSCGRPGGSAEILLKAALRAAEEDHGADVALVRLEELRLPSGADAPDPDDAPWLWEQLVEADGLIVSTPIMSRTVAARFKVVVDRLLGPNADAAMLEAIVARRRAGEEVQVPFDVDERVLRSRVGAFIAVGGSLTPQWKTLTLPLMHTMTLSMHIAVVDQVQFEGAGTPRSIVLDDLAVDRAAQLGRNVAEQIGRPFDDAEFRGDPGVCPMCHLDVVVLHGKAVECATCGARGTLVVDRGKAAVRFDAEGLRTSVLTMTEKRDHVREIEETLQRQLPRADEIARRASPWDGWDRRITPSASTAV
jgi:multimeric flavodoxin WrbA